MVNMARMSSYNICVAVEHAILGVRARLTAIFLLERRRDAMRQ